MRPLMQPYMFGLDFEPVWVAGAAVMLIVITVAALSFGRGERRYLAVGWLWFLGILAPVIGIVQVGIQSMADRCM